MLVQLKPIDTLWETIDFVNEKRLERKDLDDSILYAKRIQDGMMLKEKHLQRIFPESFLFLKPRDIVSGDFYWFTKINHKAIIAAADCTGHGIPGALMSILGISLLNQIVIEERNTDPSFILQRLDHKVHKAFSYTESMLEEHEKEVQNDGLDISLCCIDFKSKTLQFAGAYSPLYHVCGEHLHEIKGSRYPIGGINLGSEKLFETKHIDLEKGDTIYLCTDGYASQFGHYTDKKFSAKNLKNLLLQTSFLPFDKQKAKLESSLKQWQLMAEQTDDILVTGFKIP